MSLPAPWPWSDPVRIDPPRSRSLASAGTLGIAFSYWIASLLNPVIPEDLFKVGVISIDQTVLGFSLLVTLLTPLAFGLAPALSASNVNLTVGLKEGSKGSGGLSASRGRQMLVVTQVALAVVLTTGAGLMLRSFASVQGLDLGFDADRVATTEIILGADQYPSAVERRAFMAQAVAVASRAPGVTAASASLWLPLNHETISDQVAPASLAGSPADEWPLAVQNNVYPLYFETMGIELTAGRDFASMDGDDGQAVVVVNETLASRFWPGGDAIGQSLLVGDPADWETLSVIGVRRHALPPPGGARFCRVTYLPRP